MEALLHNLTRFGIFKPTIALQEGLSRGDITRAQALDEVFTATYGHPGLWTIPAREWRDAVFEQYSLQPEAPYTLPDGEEVSIKTDYLTGTRIEFRKNIPPDLQALLTHPNLQGWTCLAGVLNLRNYQPEPGDNFPGFPDKGDLQQDDALALATAAARKAIEGEISQEDFDKAKLNTILQYPAGTGHQNPLCQIEFMDLRWDYDASFAVIQLDAVTLEVVKVDLSRSVG